MLNIPGDRPGEGEVLIRFAAPRRLIQEAGSTGHQGDQGIRNEVNGTTAPTPILQTGEETGETMLMLESYREPRTSVSTPN
jgi:hypothetical protein